METLLVESFNTVLGLFVVALLGMSLRASLTQQPSAIAVPVRLRDR